MIKQCPRCNHIFDTDDAEIFTDDYGRSHGHNDYIICPRCGYDDLLEDYLDPEDPKEEE